jgi:gluconate kinase
MAGALLADDDGIYWLDNYAEAIQEAKRTGRPIFLEFRCEP